MSGAGVIVRDMTGFSNVIDNSDIYGTMLFRRKEVVVDKRAEKELRKCSKAVRLKFEAAFDQLEIDGYLEEPYAKKLTGYKQLFEIRIKHKGQWRAVYAYLMGAQIVILSVFAKKTQQTPKYELLKALYRLKTYWKNI